MAANAPASVIHADQCCLPIALSAVILNWAIAQNIIAEVMTAIAFRAGMKRLPNMSVMI